LEIRSERTSPTSHAVDQKESAIPDEQRCVTSDEDDNDSQAGQVSQAESDSEGEGGVRGGVGLVSATSHTRRCFPGLPPPPEPWDASVIPGDAVSLRARVPDLLTLRVCGA
jgi:hypothetical protein